MDSREVIRKLRQEGWFEVAQAGSHKQFKHLEKPGRVTVPFPKKDIPKGTLKSIESRPVSSWRNGGTIRSSLISIKTRTRITA